MATRTRNLQATASRSSAQRDDDLDPCELADLDDSWVEKLRTERARRAHLNIYDYIELDGF